MEGEGNFPIEKKLSAMREIEKKDDGANADDDGYIETKKDKKHP